MRDFDGLFRVTGVVAWLMYILAVVVPLGERKDESVAWKDEFYLCHEEGRMAHDPPIGP